MYSVSMFVGTERLDSLVVNVLSVTISEYNFSSLPTTLYVTGRELGSLDSRDTWKVSLLLFVLFLRWFVWPGSLAEGNYYCGHGRHDCFEFGEKPVCCS